MTLYFVPLYSICSWVNAPPCDFCGGQTVDQGMGAAQPSESAYGASRIELYG